jgi:hypothetical protein
VSKQNDTLILIGIKLKRIRIAKGYTSYENFAFDNELNAAYYFSVEKGRNITIVYLERILKIHNITLEEFFKGFI